MMIVTVDEMRAIEAEANEGGVSYAQMMETAGNGVAEAVEAAHSHDGVRSVLGLVGPGNNGGDTLIALERLARMGWQARAYLVRERSDTKILVDHLAAAGGEITSIAQDEGYESLLGMLAQSTVVLDGILGTGIQLPLRDDIVAVLAKVKISIAELDTPPQVVAVDCPSGVDCDSGEAADVVVAADMTICMEAVKIGLLNPPASALVGDLRVVTLGLPDNLRSNRDIRRRVVDVQMVKENLPKRPRDAHKGTFGTAMIAAGSINYTGAALLAGKAAYRVGAGLVTLAVPAPLHTSLAGQFPEATWLLLPHEQGVIAEGAEVVLTKGLAKATALLLGPGWGQEETTAQFLTKLLSGNAFRKRGAIGFVHPEDSVAQPATHLPPLVIDADGLKLLAKISDWPDKLPRPAVLTPHPGEMEVLTGLSTQAIQADRVRCAERYARDWGHVVVLKGAFTVIAAPDGETSVIPVATPALARAGTGDVLAGMIVGLMAQHVPGYPAAVAAAWLHAASGLAAQEIFGAAAVMAGDVLAALPQVLRS